jgi:hypothetical protein
VLGSRFCPCCCLLLHVLSRPSLDKSVVFAACLVAYCPFRCPAIPAIAAPSRVMEAAHVQTLLEAFMTLPERISLIPRNHKPATTSPSP